MATVQQQTTQLEFHQAMADFKTMFPDMDDEVIEAVLRANQGAVDATIDQLLAMTTDNENEKLRNEIEQKETLAVIPPVSASAETSPARSPHRSLQQVQNTEIAMRTVRGWAPPLLGPLPDDFLRLTPTPWEVSQKKQAMVLSQQMLQEKYAENQRVRGVLCEVGDPELDRYLEDERIALFLQNEEFMAELRWNKDFLSTLEKDQAEESPPEETLASFPLSKSLSGSHDEDALFKERLRNMGKSIYFDTRKRIIDYIMSSHQMLQRCIPQVLCSGTWHQSPSDVVPHPKRMHAGDVLLQKPKISQGT